MNKQKFIKKYSDFQRKHNLLTVSFLILLAFQAIILIIAGDLLENITGLQTILIIVVESLLYLALSMLHLKKNGIFCPECSKQIVYKQGWVAIKTEKCPYCNVDLFHTTG